MNKANSENLTAEQRAELEALAALPDARIDTSDIPEALDWNYTVKQQLTLRLDADVVDWFKRHAEGGKGYQTDINRALRAYVMEKEG